MATKDRTSLKNDFANGKYATGEKFADLIDSMKVVQLPVVDPQALGTSLSFIDSISQDADGKITATKKTLDLANAHELNPFKGWYKTGNTLPTDGFDGAYLYFKDTSELTGQTTIYRWNGTAYADTGTVVDTSNVQTFETGQALNGVAIDDTNLANPASNALVKGVDARLLNSMLRGMSYTEDKATVELGAGFINETGAIEGSTANAHAIITLSGVDKVRFSGVLLASYASATAQKNSYCFWDENDLPIGNIVQYSLGDAEQDVLIDIIVPVPQGAAKFVCSVRQVNRGNFYCYLIKGHTTGDMLATDAKEHPFVPNICQGFVDSSGIWVAWTGTPSNPHRSDLIDVSALKGRRIILEKDNSRSFYGNFLKNDTLVNGQAPSYCDGHYGRWVHKANRIEITIPNDCNYLLIYRGQTRADNVDMPAGSLPMYDIKYLVYSPAGKVAITELQEFPFYKENAPIITRFQMKVETAHTQQTNWQNVTLDTTAASAVYDDNCILYLPENYSEKGKPTKLIIFCKQGSSKIGINSDNDYCEGNAGVSPITSLPFMPYLLSIGYAILGVDGEPDGWLENLGLESAGTTTNADLRCYGNYVAVQSTRRAYEYVMHKYNLDPNGCYIFGYSQGGLLVQNVIDLTQIPILAAAEISPSCSIHWHQWDNVSSQGQRVGIYTGVTRVARLVLSRMYGITDADVTNAELATLDWDDVEDKLSGYDPWMRNVENEFTNFVNDGVYKFGSGVTVDDVEMVKHVRCPVKVWLAEGDETLGVDVTKAFIKAIKNSGQVADIVIYNNQGSASAHSWFKNQTNVTDTESGEDATVNYNGTDYTYKPIALDIATWFRGFGGY